MTETAAPSTTPTAKPAAKPTASPSPTESPAATGTATTAAGVKAYYFFQADKMEDIPEIDFSFLDDILQEHNITVSEDVSQRSYFVWESDFNTVDTREYWRDLPRLAMSIRLQRYA